MLFKIGICAFDMPYAEALRLWLADRPNVHTRRVKLHMHICMACRVRNDLDATPWRFFTSHHEAGGNLLDRPLFSIHLAVVAMVQTINGTKQQCYK